MAISRSEGLDLGNWWGPRPGGGMRGATPELDALVVQAAYLLSDLSGQDVEIRFNSDRWSGGAFLRNQEGPRTLGISCGLYPDVPEDLSIAEYRRAAATAPRVLCIAVFAGIGRLRDPALADRGPPGQEYAYPAVADLGAAVAWIREHVA